MKRGIQRAWLVAVLSAAIAGCGDSNSPQESFDSATKLLAEKRYPAAIIELKNTLKADPNHAEARWLLGVTYLDTGNAAAARKELEKAASLGYRAEEARALLLQALYAQGEFQEVLEQAPQADSTSAAIDDIVLRASANLALGNDEAAASVLASLAEREDSKKNLNFQLASARLALFRQDLAAAGDAIAAAELIKASDFDLHMLQGQYAMVSLKPTEAEVAFSKAVALRPPVPQPRIGLINAMLAQRAFNSADQEIEKLAKIIPESPMVEYLRGYSAYINGKPKVAKDHLLKVVGFAPNHTQSQLLLANILFSEQRYEQAETMVAAILDNHPLFAPALKLMGAIKLQRSRPDEAITALQSLDTEELQDVQSLALLGSAYMTAGDLSKGREILDRAAALAPDSEVIRTQQALGQMRAGNVDQAVAELEAIAANSDDISRADILLVFTHLGSRNYDKVIELAERLAERVPESPVPLNLMGAAELGKSNNAKAREYFRKSLELQSDFVPGMVNLANLDLSEGDSDAASAMLDKALALQPTHSRALVMKAFIAANAGDVDAGVDLLEQARRTNPNALEPRFLLTRHYMQQGKNELGLAVAQESVDIAPQNSNALQLLGSSQMRAGETAAALETFQILAKKHPGAPRIALSVAEAQANLAQLEDAGKTLNEALEQSPQDIGLLLADARLALATGDKKRAIARAGEAAKAAPDNPKVDILKGDLALADKDTEAAIAAYRQAKDKGGQAEAVLRWYRAERYTGNDDAVAILKSYQQEAPGEPTTALAIAIDHQEFGRNEAAIGAYESILEKTPDNVVVLNNLAWMQYEAGNENALLLAERARKLAPNSPEVNDTAGWIMVEMDKLEQGLELLRIASEQAPANASIQYHFAAGLVKAGSREQAREILTALLSGESKFPEQEQAKELLSGL